MGGLDGLSAGDGGGVHWGSMGIWRYFVDEHALEGVVAGLPLGGLLGVVGATVLVLTKGADWLVEGAAGLALGMNLPKVVIGATILSLGTTSPEAFVSVTAAFSGNPGLALGNGVGSIIADTGLIFGLTVLIAAPPMNRWVLNRTGWWQIGSALVLTGLAGVAAVTAPGGAVLAQWMGGVLVGLLGVYLWMTYRWARSGGGPDGSEEAEGRGGLSMGMLLLMLGGGLALVVGASRMLIPAAGETARRLGVPDEVIAATMVALGTSLPELTTAVAAIRKGHPEITVGNIVGADVLNVLFVIGAASLAVPLAVPRSFYVFHFPVMLLILFSFRVFIGLGRGGRFRRWQGVWLLALYAGYVVLQY